MNKRNIKLAAIVALGSISLLASCADQGSTSKTAGITASFTQANPKPSYGDPETRSGW
jgi:ABC-type oligopeptide transport system substrate-binding subunit